MACHVLDQDEVRVDRYAGREWSCEGGERLMDNEAWLLLRIALAMLLGAVLGLERELGRHAAGLRTHMMISGAAALIIGLGDMVAEQFAGEQYRELLQLDPVRLIEAVVAAVGFVGAGTILRSRNRDTVHGLTTASSLLMAAAIGVAAGLGRYVLAVGAAILAVVVLQLFKRIESKMER